MPGSNLHCPLETINVANKEMGLLIEDCALIIQLDPRRQRHRWWWDTRLYLEVTEESVVPSGP